MLTLMAKNRTLLTSLFPQAFNTTMVHCSQSLSQSWKLKVEKKKIHEAEFVLSAKMY